MTKDPISSKLRRAMEAEWATKEDPYNAPCIPLFTIVFFIATRTERWVCVGDKLPDLLVKDARSLHNSELLGFVIFS